MHQYELLKQPNNKTQYFVANKKLASILSDESKE